MLKQRIITALILIPIFVIFLIFSSTQAFVILTSLVILLAGREWAGFMGLRRPLSIFLYLICLAAVLAGVMYLNTKEILSLVTLFSIVSIGWLLATGLVISYPQLSQCWGKSLAVKGLMGFFVLIPTWISINYIHVLPGGPYQLLYLFILIWGADSGAYFIGKKWGKTKLLPQVSPGKSWQGFAGACMVTAIIALLTLSLFQVPWDHWLGFLFISLVAVVFSVIGDLFESMLKRNADMKDSGTLLPGHGGIMDRIDSLTAAAPIFLFLNLLFTKI